MHDDCTTAVQNTTLRKIAQKWKAVAGQWKVWSCYESPSWQLKMMVKLIFCPTCNFSEDHHKCLLHPPPPHTHTHIFPRLKQEWTTWSTSNLPLWPASTNLHSPWVIQHPHRVFPEKFSIQHCISSRVQSAEILGRQLQITEQVCTDTLSRWKGSLYAFF